MIFEPCFYSGKITPPPSKSYSHRALICAASCKGEKSVIRNILLCDDIGATSDCLRELGAGIEFHGSTAEVTGTGLIPVKNTVFNCRESGSTLRFIMPFAMLSEYECSFRGDGRLLSRPLDVYESISEEQGLFFEREQDEIRVCGPMSTGLYRVDGSVSSQFITGLMLSLGVSGDYSIIEIVPPVVSASYIGITVDVMRRFGFSVSVNDNRIIIDGSVIPRSADITVEADWSAAAHVMAFNMTGSDIEICGLNGESCQGDRIIRAIFGRMRRCRPTVDISDCPDLAPVIMAVAPFYHGVTLISTDRLNDKESRRGEAMAEELEKFGVSAAIGNDRIDVEPASELIKPSLPVSSHNDHRIAMACAVLLSHTGGELTGSESVSKSYPGFFSELSRLRILSKDM